MVTVLLLRDGLPVEVVLSTEFCLSAVGPAVEEIGLEAEPPIDELELLMLATLFDGFFVALLALVPCGRDALTALRLDASSPRVPASATVVAALSPATLVLATFTGDEVLDSVTLEVGGAGREAVPEAVMVRSSSSAPPTTIATIVPKAMPK